MSTVVKCYPCRFNQHERCAKSSTRPGVLGGWVCACQHSVCKARRADDQVVAEQGGEG